MSGTFKDGSTVPRQDLYELVSELEFSELGLVANRISPPLYVDETSAYYPVLPQENVAKVPDIDRAPDGSFNEDQWIYDSKTYATSEMGFSSPVDETQAKKNKKFIDEEAYAAQDSKEKLWLGLESKVAAKLYNETTFAGSSITNPSTALFTAATDCLLTVKDEMDDKQNSKPRDVFKAAYDGVLRKKCPIAKKFYSVVMSDDLVSFMVESDDIVNNTIYTTPLIDKPIEAKRAFLAACLGYKEIIPVSAMFDSAGYGKDASFAKFWSNEYALIALISDGRQSFKERTLTRQPVWRGYANGQEFEIDSWFEKRTKKIYYRASTYRGIIVNTEYGVLLKNMKTTVGTDNI